MESGVDIWKCAEKGTGQVVEGRNIVNRSVLVAMVMRKFGPKPQRVGLLYINYLIITQRFDGFPRYPHRSNTTPAPPNRHHGRNWRGAVNGGRITRHSSLGVLLNATRPQLSESRDLQRQSARGF
jgi:hypothetical protein